MNVPKLRFKEFNDNYLRLKYKDVLKIKSGKDQKQVECENGIYPILGTGGQIGKTNSFLYDKPSVLIGRKGTINKPQYMETPFWTVDTLFYSHIYEPNIPKYLFYSFQNVNWRKYDESTGVPSLSSSTIEGVDCNIPSKEEQLKVAYFLSLLDKKIELQSKKIEDLKLFKKGLVNHIIKNIEIEKIPLKNILVEQNNKTSKNNEYEILSSTSKGLYLQKDYFNKQAASDNNVGYKILKKNQLVLSPQNLWMGNINVNTEYNIGIVSPSYKIFNISNNVNIDFFNYWIKSPKALFEYKISSEQGASIVRRNLNMDLFYEIIVDLPRGKLQNKVGKIIKLLNLNIQYNEFLLQKLLELKKGLMQNMFV